MTLQPTPHPLVDTVISERLWNSAPLQHNRLLLFHVHELSAVVHALLPGSPKGIVNRITGFESGLLGGRMSRSMNVTFWRCMYAIVFHMRVSKQEMQQGRKHYLFGGIRRTILNSSGSQRVWVTVVALGKNHRITSRHSKVTCKSVSWYHFSWATL